MSQKSKNTVKSTYYVADQHIFSEDSGTYTIYLFSKADLAHFPSTPSTPQDLINHNQAVLAFLENLSSHKKTVQLGGTIKDMEHIRTMIASENPAFSFQEPSSDDYAFEEKTAQLPIAQQFHESLEQLPLKELRESVEEYQQHAKPLEDRLLEQYSQQLEELRKQIKDKEKKQEDLRNQIKQTKKRKKQEEKILETLQHQETELRAKLTHPIISSRKQEQRRKKIKRKLSSCEFSIEDLQLTIDIHEAHLKTLDDWWKMGKRRHLSWLEIYCSLGLLYFTKFSDLRYRARQEKVKITRINEKITKIKRRKKQFEHELQLLEQELQEELPETKKQELNSKQKTTAERIKEQEKTIASLNRELESSEEESNTVRSAIEKLNSEYEETENHKETYLSQSSLSRIEETMENLLSHIEEETTRLRDLINQLKEQTIELEGSWMLRPE